jgi:hypothetical protein
MVQAWERQDNKLQDYETVDMEVRNGLIPSGL